MYLSEKISLRLKRVYIGIAIGLAIWLLYASYLIISSATSAHTSIGSYELVLTPIAPIQK
ncbi:hypothetical protein [Polynucleobacter ibericus]|uniref:hypothetical protein n=1 Tax=Polynucleobacter ibericus TaxID=1819725 RepID=UPI001BFEABE3|nr:hypothetical protein [Polynucleobacter ibericus]QWE08069.1 hypothetical protein AOC20_06450 [Polynucleobacter ibericus]